MAFSNRISRKFQNLSQIWIELYIVILWILWLECNDMAFNQTHWPTTKLLQKIWLVINYGQMEWEWIKIQCKRIPYKKDRLVHCFWIGGVAKRCLQRLSPVDFIRAQPRLCFSAAVEVLPWTWDRPSGHPEGFAESGHFTSHS